MRRTCIYGGRTYTVDNVCMRIYDSENRLIQMLSLAQARDRYADILARMSAESEMALSVETLKL